mgnify:CR=1 FL=1
MADSALGVYLMQHVEYSEGIPFDSAEPCARALASGGAITVQLCIDKTVGEVTVPAARTDTAATLFAKVRAALPSKFGATFDGAGAGGGRTLFCLDAEGATLLEDGQTLGALDLDLSAAAERATLFMVPLIGRMSVYGASTKFIDDVSGNLSRQTAAALKLDLDAFSGGSDALAVSIPVFPQRADGSTKQLHITIA